MDEMWMAILRKLIFMALLYVAFVTFDRRFLAGFKTSEVLKNDPKAIAVLGAGVAVAFALA